MKHRLLVLLLLCVLVACSARAEFDGRRALQDVEAQVAFGPRVPGSDAHARALAWFRSELAAAGWQTEVIESVTRTGRTARNLIARRDDRPPLVLLGAHYDSRRMAERDPDPARRAEPVPGANDGASGVAVLLEIARVLPQESVPVWLVFFDLEDQGELDGQGWSAGARAFVAQMTVRPQAVVIVDMIGDADLSIPMEGSSDPALRAEIWQVAADLGYGDVFLPRVKYNMIDDHLPFVEAGIPAVLLIDFDYAYWHTTADTPDKVSAESLRLVGRTLLAWLEQYGRRTGR